MSLCSKCARDAFLSDEIQTNGEGGLCSVCRATDQKVIKLDRLRLRVEGVIQAHFDVHVDLHRGYDGLDLRDVICRVLQFDDPLCDVLYDQIVIRNTGDLYADTDAFFFEEQTYDPHHAPRWAFDDWDEIVKELKHHRRFFSDRALLFFKKLVDEALDSKRRGLFSSKQSVVFSIPAGTSMYRARKANSDGDIDRLLRDPANELGAPPITYANDGRVNPTGIRLFYGSEDEATPIAEVRPSVGETVIIGKFKTTQKLRIFDFLGLEMPRAHSPVSYFGPNVQSTLHFRQVLGYLHQAFKRAVTPSNKLDYVITQALAEYLAYKVEEPFDGVRFQSSQVKGINLVLFPGPMHKVGGNIRREDRFPVEWARVAPTRKTIWGVTYETDRSSKHGLK